jgi:catalase
MVANDRPASTFRYNEKPVYTASNGCPVEHPTKYQRIANGPLLLQDFHLIDLLAHFDRERIPERVVHAKGAGAYGEVRTLRFQRYPVTCLSLTICKFKVRGHS